MYYKQIRRSFMDLTICKVCNMEGTRIADPRYGAEACTECYSVEQGFYWLDEWKHNENYLVDEDGNIFNEDLEIVASEIWYDEDGSYLGGYGTKEIKA